jgi:hypothetical protein
VSWVKPADNGKPITGYSILLQHFDGSFTTELVNCNGADETIIAAQRCQIPLSVLQAAPFSISTLGSPIKAKVIAINAYGES